MTLGCRWHPSNASELALRRKSGSVKNVLLQVQSSFSEGTYTVILLVNQLLRFQYNFKYLIWFFSNFYKVEIFKINLLFLNTTFWSCDIATSCNILATKFFLHKEPSVCLDSLPLIVIILLVIIQLITYQQLSEIKPLEISSSTSITNWSWSTCLRSQLCPNTSSLHTPPHPKISYPPHPNYEK